MRLFSVLTFLVGGGAIIWAVIGGFVFMFPYEDPPMPDGLHDQIGKGALVTAFFGALSVSIGIYVRRRHI